MLGLGGDDAELVGKICVDKLFKSELHEVLVAVLGFPIVDDISFRKENDSIEHLENFCAGLVNCCHDGLSTISFFA